VFPDGRDGIHIGNEWRQIIPDVRCCSAKGTVTDCLLNNLVLGTTSLLDVTVCHPMPLPVEFGQLVR